MNRTVLIPRGEYGSFGRTVIAAIQVLFWLVGTWLTVSLIGSLRWLSPTLDPSPDAYQAVLVKLLLLGGFIACIWLSGAGERREQALRRRALPTVP